MKKRVTMWLSPESIEFLKTRATFLGISQASVMEIAIKREERSHASEGGNSPTRKPRKRTYSSTKPSGQEP